MRTALCLAVAACSVFAAVGSTAVANQAERRTLEQCAALLPKGEKFSFELTGTVDTSGATPKLSGEFSMSDGTQRDRQQDGAAFQACFARLVR